MRSDRYTWPINHTGIGGWSLYCRSRRIGCNYTICSDDCSSRRERPTYFWCSEKPGQRGFLSKSRSSDLLRRRFIPTPIVLFKPACNVSDWARRPSTLHTDRSFWLWLTKIRRLKKKIQFPNSAAVNSVYYYFTSAILAPSHSLVRVFKRRVSVQCAVVWTPKPFTICRTYEIVGGSDEYTPVVGTRRKTQKKKKRKKRIYIMYPQTMHIQTVRPW